VTIRDAKKVLKDPDSPAGLIRSALAECLELLEGMIRDEDEDEKLYLPTARAERGQESPENRRKCP